LFVLCSMLPVSIFLCFVPIVTRTRVYLSVSCAQCYPVYMSVSCAQRYSCLSLSVLCPMLPVSIFLCLLPNVTRVYLSMSGAQCYPCLSFCVLCPMLLVSIFLCLLPNVPRVYLSVSCAQCSPCLSFCVHWAQETERWTRVTLGTRHRKIDTGNIGHKTQKDRHG
jgi:hypothetical protein